MNAVDTNVLVYHIDTRDPTKQAKAQALLGGLIASGQDTVLLWQAAGEFLQQLRRWEGQGIISWRQVIQFFGDVRATYRLVLPSNRVLDRSLDLTSRFSLSHWDSMIVAACIEAGVTKLYTEDMGSPTKFESLELENRFV
jgi:predicted nucleic acid-binding protein